MRYAGPKAQRVVVGGGGTESGNQLDTREIQNVLFLIKSENQEHKFHLINFQILHFRRLGFVQTNIS